VTEEPKKSVFRQWWFWLLFIIVGAVAAVLVVVLVVGTDFIGQFVAPSSSPTATAPVAPTATVPSDTAPVSTGPLTLDDGWELDKSGVVPAVIGFVSNSTNQDVGMEVSISFDAYDKDGRIIGACADTISSLEAGSKWRFTAICTSPNVESIQFRDLVSY